MMVKCFYGLFVDPCHSHDLPRVRLMQSYRLAKDPELGSGDFARAAVNMSCEKTCDL